MPHVLSFLFSYSGIQEAPVVTPLMEYVRKKRAAKSSNQVGFSCSNLQSLGIANLVVVQMAGWYMQGKCWLL